MSRPAAWTPSNGRSRSDLDPSSGNELHPISAGASRAVSRALTCAGWGWPVFPCRPGTKEPATRHGFRDATTDQEQIRSWWERWPDANLAIATGTPGPDVLDVDDHGEAGNGYAALGRLQRARFLEGAGAVVRTPHGGLHLYFVGSTQPSGRLADHHLDFKAAGGYVVAPPSQVDGRPYYMVRQAEPRGELSWRMAAAALEPHPARSARAATRAIADARGLAGWVGRLEEGNRNAGLFWAACRAVEAGQPRALDEIAAAASSTGLGLQEIARTIDSARRYGARQPGRSGQVGCVLQVDRTRRQADREATP